MSSLAGAALLSGCLTAQLDGQDTNGTTRQAPAAKIDPGTYTGEVSCLGACNAEDATTTAPFLFLEITADERIFISGVFVEPDAVLPTGTSGLSVVESVVVSDAEIRILTRDTLLLTDAGFGEIVIRPEDQSLGAVTYEATFRVRSDDPDVICTQGCLAILRR